MALRKDTFIADGIRVHRWQDPDQKFLATVHRHPDEGWPWKYEIFFGGVICETRATTSYSIAVDCLMDFYRLVKREPVR